MTEVVNDTSVPVVAVTAAVGAVVLLFVLLCSATRRAPNEEDDKGTKNIGNKVFLVCGR